MAETRKHRIEVRDELDKALLAALGEPVRPVEPGASTGSAAADATDEASPAPASGGPFVTPGSSLGGFSFGAPKC